MLNTIAVAAVISILAGQGDKPRVAVAGTPYASLFQHNMQVQPDVKLAAGHVVEIPRGMKLERGPCGMPIIVASAEFDRGIITPIPENARTAARIRAVEPDCFNRK